MVSLDSMSKPPLDEALTQKVALLARLELTSEEIQEFTGQLIQALQVVESIHSVDVQSVEPCVHPVRQETYLRSDEVEVSALSESNASLLLGVAPSLWKGSYKVPQVL